MKELRNKTVALTRNGKFNGYAKVILATDAKIQVRYDSGFEMTIKLVGANGTGYVGVTGNGASWTVTEKAEEEAPAKQAPSNLAPPKPKAPTVSFEILGDEEEGHNPWWGVSKTNHVITVGVNELEALRLEGELDALRFEEPHTTEYFDGELMGEDYRRYVENFHWRRNDRMEHLRAQIKELRGH